MARAGGSRLGGLEGIEEGGKARSGNLGPHDIGGLEEEYGAIDRTERAFHLWEMQVSCFKVTRNSRYNNDQIIIVYSSTDKLDNFIFYIRSTS